MKKILILLVFISSNSFAKEEFFYWGVVATTCESFLDLYQETEQYVEDYGDDQIISSENYFTAVFQGYLSGLNTMSYALDEKWRDLNFNDEEYLFYYMKNACSKDQSEKISSFLIDYYTSLPFSK